LHPHVRDAAKRRAQALGFGNSFSAYIAKLLADDLAAHPAPTKPASPSSVTAAQIVSDLEQRVHGNPAGTAPAAAPRKRKGSTQ
jgi:hypothetical protein